jgi:hypothetical protein
VVNARQSGGLILGTLEADTAGQAILEPFRLNEFPSVTYVDFRRGETVLATVSALAVSPAGPNLFGGETSNLFATGVGIAVEPVIDLSNASSTDIQSLRIRVRWDTSRFSFHQAGESAPPWLDSDGGRAVVTIDETLVSGGELVFEATVPGASISSFRVAKIYLYSRPPFPFTSEVHVEVLSAKNSSGADVVFNPGRKLIVHFSASP